VHSGNSRCRYPRTTAIFASSSVGWSGVGWVEELAPLRRELAVVRKCEPLENAALLLRQLVHRILGFVDARVDERPEPAIRRLAAPAGAALPPAVAAAGKELAEQEEQRRTGGARVVVHR